MDHPCDTEAVVHVAHTEPFSSVFFFFFFIVGRGPACPLRKHGPTPDNSLWAANNFLGTHALCEQEVVTGAKPNKKWEGKDFNTEAWKFLTSNCRLEHAKFVLGNFKRFTCENPAKQDHY
jgi:hypothetical protein